MAVEESPKNYLEGNFEAVGPRVFRGQSLLLDTEQVQRVAVVATSKEPARV